MTQQKPYRDERGILTRKDGASIAYHRVICGLPHAKRPTVVFLHGLMSDMEGGKAIELADHARKRGFDYLRFDMFGHGESSGNFTDGSIGRWCEDTIEVLEKLTTGPLILIGSSMGGWVMLRVASQHPERIKGLIGIAAAPDFTEESMWASMSNTQKQTMMDAGIVVLTDNTSRPLPVSRALIEDGREQLLFTRPITYNGTVRLLQGMQDASVPWKNALRICEGLTSQDVSVDLIKDGDHRLSRPQDLARLTRTTDELIAQICGEDEG